MAESGISVVICCHNSAERLPPTLAHIAAQQLESNLGWEVVIVDNACLDNTAASAVQCWQKLATSIPLRVVSEPRLGLSYAREKGFASAKYPLIAFSDDDNWLQPDYLQVACNLMNRYPQIGILGGCGEPVFELEPPDWLKGMRLFAVGPQAESSGKVSANIVYGAGFVFRKSAYQRLRQAGFASLLPDRMAKNLSSGGDYELCYVTAMAGYEIWYEEKMRFKHYFPAERLTWEYYIKYIEESLRCFEVIEPCKILASGPGAMKKGYFSLRLIWNFLYFFRKYMTISLRRLANDPKSSKGRIDRMNARIYRIMGTNYFRDYRRLMDNYHTCLALKKRLNGPDQLPE